MPVRFCVEMENGQHVCATCASMILLAAHLEKDEAVLLTTKHALFSSVTGFSNASLLNDNLAMDRIRKNCPDLKEIPLNKDEITAVATCMQKKQQEDPNLERGYIAYKALAVEVAQHMKKETLDDKKLKKIDEKFWFDYQVDFCRDNDAIAFAREKTDFATLKAMIAEIV